MWIEFISSLSAEVEFADPVNPESLGAATAALEESIPEDLRSLLSEANGVTDEYGTEFIWSVEQVVARNREMRGTVDFRSLYMPFDPLLFFGDSGGGDLFAFVQRPSRSDIFVWQHESDSRLWVANDLRDYLGRYLAAAGEDWYAS
ncbi:SMI1/KNR4 family protein [Streptomyces sp. NPDC019890]|uniref:SMI1/KNR4 family protein n=1 Tax=Streptomyces sp. NPDC019890 TaxID=3365064 RepID=UPI003850AAF8